MNSELLEMRFQIFYEKKVKKKWKIVNFDGKKEIVEKKYQ